MGYVLRVRLASFFTGAATASFFGFYVLYRDYVDAHRSVYQQVNGIQEALDRRIAALESFKQPEPSQPADATE